MSIIPESEFYAISFSVRGDDDNRNRGYIQVTSSDNILRDDKPATGGIYDSHMGTTSNAVPCSTCNYYKDKCPGHFGYIELNYPVLAPLFLDEIKLWLKAVCHECGVPLGDPSAIKSSRAKLLKQFVKRYYSTTIKKTASKCKNCGAMLPKITFDKSESAVIFRELPADENSPEVKIKKKLYAHEVRQIFERITNNSVESLGGVTQCHPKKFVYSAIPASPNTVRPNMTKISAGRSGSNDVTFIMKHIVDHNNLIPPGIRSSDEIDEKIDSEIDSLTIAVYEMIKGLPANSNKRGLKTVNNKQLVGIARRFPGKYGRIRKHLLGRRVMKMARSVITCDTALRINQVGIPKKIAENIHTKVEVRDYNFDECLAYFNNGIAKRYPGAYKIFKKSRDAEYLVDRLKSDMVLEIGDTIFRDIIDGDIVNFNRQPSLESSNITAHRAVIMEEGDTIRINVLACPLYNADFDGDEMNILFPGSSVTANEIEELASPEQRYISEKNARPRIGEAQDSLIGTAELTKTSTKMDKYHAMRVFSQSDVFPDFSGKQDEYSGRDIVTKYLRESDNMINYNGKPTFYNSMHAKSRRYDAEDVKIEIDRGELKSGVLDASSVGEGAPGGVFHVINNQYGPEAALEACFAVQQIALSFLFNKGVTVSMKDILLNSGTMKEIHQIESKLIADSVDISHKLNKGEIIPPIGKTVTEYFEEMQMNALDPGDEFYPWVLADVDPEDNNLYKLIAHGSKGKMMNLRNISAAIGQIEINGARIDEKFGGRACPYFCKNDNDPKARGYIANSYRSGMEPSEFMFHAQEARYQLISTALNTSVTGMQNRMAVKNLEALVVDNRRMLTKTSGVVQFASGGDNVDPRKIQRARFATMSPEMSTKEFEKQFRSEASAFGKKFANKQVQKVLDEEFAKLARDREWYAEVFLKYEASTGVRYTDTLAMPVNVRDVIEDTLYDLGMKSEEKEGEASAENPVEIVEKVRKFVKNLSYTMMNDVAEKRQSRVPAVYRNATKMMRVLVRGYLSVAYLRRKKIGLKVLDIVLRKIKLAFSKSLVSYGFKRY
jgi:DNA-directed RNA polymerase beta' subunit